MDSEEEEEGEEEEREVAGAGAAGQAGHYKCGAAFMLPCTTTTSCALRMHACCGADGRNHASAGSFHTHLANPAGAGAPPAAQQQQRSGVTLAMVEGWCAAAREKASMGAVRNIIKVGALGGSRCWQRRGGCRCCVQWPSLLTPCLPTLSPSLPLDPQAYRAACHYGDSEEEVEESMRIASSAVYNKLMLFVLVRRGAAAVPARLSAGRVCAGKLGADAPHDWSLVPSQHNRAQLRPCLQHCC